LTKDKLMLSKIASVRQKKSDFLRDSKKLFETSFGKQEEENKNESLKNQEKRIFNHFKRFIGVDYHLFQKHGIIKKPNPESICDILTTTRNKGTPNILKDVFVNAFPGIYAKSKFPEFGFCDTEETKTMIEERSIYSNINPIFKGFKDKFFFLFIFLSKSIIFIIGFGGKAIMIF